MKHSASFRDPAGSVFSENGHIFRAVNEAGIEDYRHLMDSGLYADLTSRSLLIPHKEATEQQRANAPTDARIVLKPIEIQTISYPYEWCFSQLQDAAIATLRIQQLSLSKGMVLKDASAYNIQFHEGKPILIDTLSFTKYTKDEPWQAYKQFCSHFLAPLSLVSYVDADLLKLIATNIDGIPLPLTLKLLPRRAFLSPGILMHLGLHSRVQARKPSEVSRVRPRLSRSNHDALIDSLMRTVRGLKWRPSGTEWAEYYSFTNYTSSSFGQKKEIVAEFIRQASPKTTWDLGGNTGEFSLLASEQGSNTVSFDIDPIAVERNYLRVKKNSETCMLPLVLDLTNPSPAIGWANAERDSLSARGPVDLVMALALIHHLAISNNLPLSIIAEYFATLGNYLIIEFVPKTDSKVGVLLQSRPDIFPSYTEKGFEDAFSVYYSIQEKKMIKGSQRTLYLLKRTMRQ